LVVAESDQAKVEPLRFRAGPVHRFATLCSLLTMGSKGAWGPDPGHLPGFHL